MDSLSCHLAAEFKQLLACLNLHHFVAGPTYTKGHTLGLVMTDFTQISDLCIQDIGISDHYAVTFRIPLPFPLAKPHHFISFKNLKNLDNTSLSQHLQLFSPPLDASVNNLPHFYNHNLLSTLD